MHIHEAYKNNRTGGQLETVFDREQYLADQPDAFQHGVIRVLL